MILDLRWRWPRRIELEQLTDAEQVEVVALWIDVQQRERRGS